MPINENFKTLTKHLQHRNLSHYNITSTPATLFHIFVVGDLGKAPEAVNDTLPTVSEPELEGATGGEEEDVSEMQARLEALRS